MTDRRYLYAEIDSLPGSEDEVRMLLAGYGARVREEPGNRQFEAFNPDGDPAKFFVYEEYESEEAFEAHKAAEYCERFNRLLAPLVVGGGSRLTLLDPIA
ncbi:antibiotic biosynthesis monooxygenase [Leifsonia sp. fls2-241-R2A-40a]|uniref:putative quinol monooxygenase n=1 Tax=Leifsonia sp. fls2-241-R2A-40a TaxID=3040290 RepID=UPI002551897E|nr:antibiotic biosynthesis monooxygenase [Leifsonia sp. fls2-241-R2A-40a]